MAVRHGYGKVAGTDALVFAYDTGDARNSYKGEPTTNYWDGVQYSIYNDNATNYRDQTFPLPPSPGYEVAKVVSNTLGTYSHSILWKAPYPNNNVATITNSVYAYLVEGSYVQVGQHWYPWYYGTQKAIPKNQWVKISETYSINEGNSYGVAALTYSTDGTAYFSMPQYEYKTHVTPFVAGTRSSTQGLLDLTGASTIDLANVSFNNNAQITFDGTGDNFRTNTNCGITGNITLEAIFKEYSGTTPHTTVICTDINYRYGVKLMSYKNYDRYGLWLGFGSSDYLAAVDVALSNNVTYHLIGTWEQSTGIVKLYLNGELTGTINTDQTSAISLSDGIITLGQDYHGSSNSYGVNGDIYLAKAYNRVLTADEVRNNYRHYKTRFNIQ